MADEVDRALNIASPTSMSMEEAQKYKDEDDALARAKVRVQYGIEAPKDTRPLPSWLTEHTDWLQQVASEHIPGFDVLAAFMGPKKGPGKVAAPNVRKGPGQLFDTSRATLENPKNWPDVEQVSHRETEPTYARGLPDWIANQKLGSEQNLDRMRALRDQGIEQGGLGWYNTKQLFDRFVDKFGPELGAERFHQFISMVSATSPGSRVPINIRDASWRYGRWLQGEPAPDLGFKPKEEGFFGHNRQQLHNQNVANIMEGRGLDPTQNPKPFRFVENLSGNVEPVTIDRWASRASNFRNKYGALVDYPDRAYGHLASLYQRLSDELANSPMQPAPGQTQSAVWGAMESPGKPIDPFIKVLADRVRHTATERGLKPEVVLRRMISGEEPLLADGGAVKAKDPLYDYSAPAGYMTESPAQDAGVYQRHLRHLDDENQAVANNSLKDQAALAAIGAGGSTALHGLRGIWRTLRGSSAQPFEQGGIGLGWQGAKVLGGSGLAAGANSVMDMPVEERAHRFMNAVHAAPAMRKEKRQGFADGGHTKAFGDQQTPEQRKDTERWWNWVLTRATDPKSRAHVEALMARINARQPSEHYEDRTRPWAPSVQGQTYPMPTKGDPKLPLGAPTDDYHTPE